MSMSMQLMWKFVAAEEDYVSQLTILHEEYRLHLEIAAASSNPPLTLQQSAILFRNRYVSLTEELAVQVTPCVFQQ